MAESTRIWVRPPAGQMFRHHQTKALHDGPFEADAGDLDIVRSLKWGALEACDAPELALAPEAVDGLQQDVPASSRRRQGKTVALPAEGEVPAE